MLASPGGSAGGRTPGLDSPAGSFYLGSPGSSGYNSPATGGELCVQFIGTESENVF